MAAEPEFPVRSDDLAEELFRLGGRTTRNLLPRDSELMYGKIRPS
jgi:hypothetical protein